MSPISTCAKLPVFAGSSGHAFGKAGICAIDGSSAVAHLPPLRGEVSGTLPDALVLPPRPVPLHGLCPTDLSRESAGHRNLPEGALGQAVPSGHPWRDRPQHAGGCQREARLAHLPGLCAQPDPSRPQALRPRRLWRGIDEHGLRAGLDHHRPLPRAVPVGEVPPSTPCSTCAAAYRVSSTSRTASSTM